MSGIDRIVLILLRLSLPHSDAQDTRVSHEITKPVYTFNLITEMCTMTANRTRTYLNICLHSSELINEAQKCGYVLIKAFFKGIFCKKRKKTKKTWAGEYKDIRFWYFICIVVLQKDFFFQLKNAFLNRCVLTRVIKVGDL